MRGLAERTVAKSLSIGLFRPVSPLARSAQPTEGRRASSLSRSSEQPDPKELGELGPAASKDLQTADIYPFSNRVGGNAGGDDPKSLESEQFHG